MISSIGSAQPYAQQSTASAQAPPKPPAQSVPQDTVSLSKAAGGDIDHDGDSH